MFNLKSLIQDHSLFSLLKMQNICILITKIVLQIIDPSSADYILTLKFKTKAGLLFEKNNVQVCSPATVVVLSVGDMWSQLHMYHFYAN